MTLPTQLFHYSYSEVGELVPDFYDKYKKYWQEEGSIKPLGLWVSVEETKEDYSWYDWCVDQQFRLENLRYKYKVKIYADANILYIKTPEELTEFTVLYAANDPYALENNPNSPYVYMIKWGLVKEKYDGIIISPYQWDCRLKSLTSWYYPWDCSCACIWNLYKCSLKLDSIIDVQAITVNQEEESETDSLLASLVPLK